MTDYINSNLHLLNFWAEKLEEIKVIKGSTHELEYEEGLDLIGYLKRNFGEEREGFLTDLERFVYATLRRLYETATLNVTDFPEDLNDLINDLPFDNTRYTSFENEYLQVKSEVIDNYQINLKQTNKIKDEISIVVNNQSEIITALFKKVLGFYEKNNLSIEIINKNFPQDFNVTKSYDRLSTQLFNHLKKEVLGGRTLSKVLHHEKRKNQLLNDILGTTALPRDWVKKLAKKTDLDAETTRANNLQTWKNNHVCSCSVPCHDPSHSDYSTCQTESQEYQRIHTKLSGKVSDSELQTLLNAIPNCSHSDYDALKSERDTLKTENTQLKEHKCDCDSKVAQREKEIIDKIITDLSLSTERERERESILEAVITEIKNKITPPQDNSDLTSLQTQLKNKEAEISELKKGNQSYLDLEKLVQQKQSENQSLTTAKNELESQLNQKQKELLTQVLNKSSEVKEKVYKEELIKVIETSLTSQGISSQEFRKEVNALSSLTDIQKLSDKYSSQKVSELESERKSANSLNVVLGVLSLASLIALAYLLIKGSKKSMERDLKSKES